MKRHGNMSKLIHPIADEPKSGYDPDCRKCFNGVTHTLGEHELELFRAWGVSYWEYDFDRE